MAGQWRALILAVAIAAGGCVPIPYKPSAGVNHVPVTAEEAPAITLGSSKHRALIEPLAKSGQLRVVVATMGLAAGINFSLRSVALAGDTYRRDSTEQLLKPEELLQMFGRAGRRGLDETGFVLITPNELRLLDAHPCHLSRSAVIC